MRVLLNHSQAKVLHNKYPNHVGVMFSPERTRYYQGVPFAIDNGAFGAFKRNEKWDSSLFKKVVEKFATLNPIFIVCPDVVGNKEKTLDLWGSWYPWLKESNVPIAFVFVDGMLIDDIPLEADYVFIGGTTSFKEYAITCIGKINKPVHVGRVNYYDRLWSSQTNGAASCDGTGWFRGNPNQKKVLLDYLSAMHDSSLSNRLIRPPKP